MSTIAELIRRADARLRGQVGVATGLADAVRQAGLDDTPTTSEVILAAQKLLADRKAALATAQRRVRQLTETVDQLSMALPFLEETWPQQRDRLREAIRKDPMDGLAGWLNYWFAAASTRRAGVLRRLQADVHLPHEFRAIAERLAITARALDEDDWLPCREVLLIGAAGVTVGARQVPDRPGPDGHKPDTAVRENLRLLAARLALHDGRLDQAELVLSTGTPSAGSLALLSRVARLTNRDTEAEQLLQQARRMDPADLDVNSELIAHARRHGGIDIALSSARAAAETLISLGDIDGDVGRLVDPPTELWIGLAERAHDEDDEDTARRLLNRAVTGDNEVLAIAAEVRATVAASDAERRRAHLVAGCRWANAGQLPRARRNHEAAAEGLPADAADAQVQAAARLRVADIVAVTARQQPYGAVGTELERALRLVLRTHPREDWSYVIESDLRVQMSRVPGRDDQVQQQWAALLAAARAVSVWPEWTPGWQALADAATTRDLYLVAEAAATRAHQSEPDSEAARAEYVRTLIDTGRYVRALRCTEDHQDPEDPAHPWWQCVRGLIALRQGRAAEAVGHFAGVNMDPAWLWAWNAAVRSLVVVGDLAAARRKSAELMRAATGREQESSWLAVVAFHARLTGDLDAARTGAQRLEQAIGPDDFRVRYAQGETLLLSADPAGWHLLVLALDADPRPAAVDVWVQEEFPVLAALAADRGVSLTPPAELDRAVQQLRIRARAGDPVTELRHAAEKAGNPDASAAEALIEAALQGTASHGESANAALARPAPTPEVLPLLRLPTSWLTDRTEAGLDKELRAWVTPRMALAGTMDLEPDGYQLLVADHVLESGRLRPERMPTPTELLTGAHRYTTLLIRPAIEVITAAYYQATPTSKPVLVTVRDLAHRSWQLRGKPTGTDRADWDVGRRLFQEFVAENAYFRWKKRGQPLFDNPLADWLAAEHDITQEGIVPGTVVDERLNWQIMLQTAYSRWQDRGRPFGSPLADWPT